MEQQVNDKNNMVVQQQELTRLRDLELQHLQRRLQEAEAAAKATTLTNESASATLTQVDPPTPITTAMISEASAAFPTEPQQPSTQPTGPTSPLPPTPELLFHEDAKEGFNSPPPPAKGLAFESPISVTASIEGGMYPPVHHGSVVLLSRLYSVWAQIKRGRAMVFARTSQPDASPKPASPTSS